MINNVGSGSTPFQNLQGLQARKSFNAADRSASVFKQALAEEVKAPQAQPKEEIRKAAAAVPQRAEASRHLEAQLKASRSQAPTTTRAQVNPYADLEPMIHEVQKLAEASGYIGVSQQDVLRAYQTGSSLLADYKV